ncbi:NUDIX domain-containing protein (plasmid) [Photobacterium sp. DA100]|uniref:NUDIX hydrolase n=1 Tax=Photobacterium sp. DA100 TaxID=3027472 RepID=UPI002479436F|nr:NUDIX domain-containing protein [Photobacterium sp. DA100]WEM45806.1 NUDIX domain-containing protein [Photobacterium sp. DA100]
MELVTNFVSGVVLTKHQQQTRMLLLKRADGGYWCQVAGSIEKSESAWQAFLRELYEETQVSPYELYSADYLQQFYNFHSDQIFVAAGFVAYCEPDTQVVLNHEHTDYRWCTLEEALELVPFPNQRKFYQHVWQYFVAQNPALELKLESSTVHFRDIY